MRALKPLKMIRLTVTALTLFAFAFSCTEETDDFREELNSIASTLNEKCPQMIDSETRIDGLSFEEPNTLTYHYTLVNVDVAKVDTVLFRRNLWPGILSNIKVSREMKPLRDHHTTLCYVYADKQNQFIYRFTITDKDYGTPTP